MKKINDMTKEELLDFVKKLKKQKKYGLVWEDKPEDVVEQCYKELPVLEEVKDKAIEKDPDSPMNLLIEGDNYHALSVLNYTHAKRVDVIYIDPPYNTGQQDFKYNDKWVDEEDYYRHSKWLSFMSKRLTLARNLLKQDGVIFINIDENELSQLKLLCDTIFGEQNRLSTHHIQVRYGNKSLNERKDFQELIEYVLIYAKDKRHYIANKTPEDYDLNKFNLEIKELKAPDKSLVINGRKVDIFLSKSYSIKKQNSGTMELFKETWLSGSIYSGTGHGKTYQKIIEPRVKTDGLSTLYKIYGLGEDGLGYRYMINTQKESSSRGKMFTKIPIEKKKAIKSGNYAEYKPIVNYYDFSPDFGNIRHEGGIAFNSGKKPIKMLKQLINYHPRKDIVVLDFFAGSGTTAEAVLILNQEDDGSRSFILSTNNENKIAENITYKRLKNVVNGYGNTKGISANIRYFKTGFVLKSKVSDDTRMELVKRSTEMICIRENTFQKIIDKTSFKVYKDNEHTTGILFDLDDLNELKKKLQEEKLTAHIYVFSLTNDTFDADFEDLGLEHELCPIPESILEVYRKLFK